MRNRILILLMMAALGTASKPAYGGGPRLIGGPAVGTRHAFGVDGKAFVWNPARMPIAYRVDPGPMAVNPSGTTVISHDAGIQRVQSMFGVWQGVATANLSFSNAGALLATGSYTGGDVKTAAQYNDVIASCNAGMQSPVIFDADGKMLASLGLPPEVIGFNHPCELDTTNGFILSSAIVMNGAFQDGVNHSSSSPPNYEMSANAFDEAITHEIGHLVGLDHSQINLDMLLQYPNPCSVDGLAGLPLMFPIAFCEARKDAGLPVLAPDDVSWISNLYPKGASPSYGVISGVIFFNDGGTPFQGANVIARQIDDGGTEQDESRRIAVSVVSGYLYTGNPGQSVTANMPGPTENNTNGSALGSRTASLIGYYQIPVPPGTYTVEVESVYYGFGGGSSVGPLSPPVALSADPEFWNLNESAFDFSLQRDTITVNAGDNITDTDIILNDRYPRFDQFEDDGRLLDAPMPWPPLPGEGVAV